MRIAIANWTDRKIGGAETYLADLLPALLRSGEELAVWCEMRESEHRESVTPVGIPAWCAQEMGRAESFAALRAWSPDVVYVHGMTDPSNEAELQKVGPAVIFAHNYHGTCITGDKTVSRPEVLPCGRHFGWSCLAHFYPRQCGGRSPITMWSNFRVQSQRLDIMRRYGAVLCASEHMRAEYVRHGVRPDRAQVVRYPIEGVRVDGVRSARSVPAPGQAWRILCAGRLERQKGGRMLLEALPLVRAATDRPLEVVFAGDGAERGALERIASELMARDPGLRIEFAGWMAAPGLHAIMETVHLHVLPSVWPEPFGIIGVEAGLLGIPTAAFAVGGIPDWLEDGVNGRLALATPPTPSRLAGAVLGCLDVEVYPELSAQALSSARGFSMETHLQLLREVLSAVAASRSAPVNRALAGS